MTDEELETAVRAAVNHVTMDVPEPSIRRRARQIRFRRRVPVAAGVAAVAAAAIAVPLGLLSGPAAPAQLDAWTIHKSGGTVEVTIRQLHDPVALQRALRADGVPVVVTDPPTRRLSSACRVYPVSEADVSQVVVLLPPAGHPGAKVLGRFEIHLSRLPASAVVWIEVDRPPHSTMGVGVDLLQADPRCAG
jgi:hypothetical protein